MSRRRRRGPPLDQLVAPSTAQALTATVSLSVEKVAEEIAREVLADETFRRELRAMIQRHSDAWLAEMRGATARTLPKKEPAR